jgi:glycosyltransferase involved in cell wall biosynthesis
MVYLVNILNQNAPTGGNIFNLEFVSKLQACGIKVLYKSGAEMATLLKDIPRGATVIVDSVCFNDVTFEWSSLNNYNSFVLLHMAPTENNMLSVNERDQLSTIEAYVFSSFPVLALGHASINYVEEKYRIRIKFSIVPNFRTVDFEKSNYNRTPVKFIGVGTVSRDKGTNLLIESLSTLENKTWTCVIYGAKTDQPFYNECTQLVNELGLNEFIQFKGVISQKELQHQYCLSDLLIHTSLHENSSMALKDAIFIGLPFVTTPTGDYEIYKKMGVGHVAKNFGLNSIAKALNEAIYRYPELVHRSKAARQEYKEETKQVSFEETIKFLIC